MTASEMASLERCSVLPVQRNVWNLAHLIKEQFNKIKGNSDAIAKHCADYAMEIAEKLRIRAESPIVTGLTSALNEPSIAYRLRVGAFTLEENAKSFLDVAISCFDTALNVYFPDEPRIWNETDLTSVMAEFRYMTCIVGSILDPLFCPPPQTVLASFYSRLIEMCGRLDQAKYEGEARELSLELARSQRGLALAQKEMAEKQSKLIAKQVELINSISKSSADQANILKEYQEQNERMKTMTAVIRWCTIVGAVAAVLGLIPDEAVELFFQHVLEVPQMMFWSVAEFFRALTH